MMTRYVCIHGHFYQPPRENPWLESVEVQDSAYPYHDWNERILEECYRSNAAARILGEDGKIERIFDNYSRMSFNFGPTLLSWMERQAPEDYRRVLESDRRSMQRFSGHGSAIAQVHDHLILPLAHPRDRRTQIRWGIADFQHRFGRHPEGMWLSETAVCLDTLEALAEQDIRFTILAPRQARRVRPLAGGSWTTVEGAWIDPRQAYLQRLPSGRSIAIFFYDGPLSQAVAFEKLLEDGRHFADRLASVFEPREGPQLVHIATDGETYGHHHRLGEMALAFALRRLESRDDLRLTNYGEFLALHPPTTQVDILESSSWSCVHGVERWRSDCGCKTGSSPHWDQSWRAPLRASLDALRDVLAGRFEDRGRGYFADPWAARDAYVSVVLDRSAASVDRFLGEHALGPLDHAARVEALSLLEMQRHAMLMYTSCGWFFDDAGGIETIQILRYAARAIQLAEVLFGEGLEAVFLDLLERMRSNDPELGDGRQLWKEQVIPSRAGLEEVAAHYALSSLFLRYEPVGADGCHRVNCYCVEPLGHEEHSAGRARLVLGEACIESGLIGQRGRFAYAVLDLGDHNIVASVGSVDPQALEALNASLRDAFKFANFPQALRLIDRGFGGSSRSLASLFEDARREILERVLERPLLEAEIAGRRLYEANIPLLRYLHGIGAALPPPLRGVAAHILGLDTRRALAAEPPELGAAAAAFGAARDLGINLDLAGIGHDLEGAIGRLSERLEREPAALEVMAALEEAARFGAGFGEHVDLWRAQNAAWRVSGSELEGRRAAEGADDPEATCWLDAFGSLTTALRMRIRIR
ncbi:MAG: DUF3536 domain-containing protein [Myxococcales bacterium]|nr:DUF3536 domain-containing protein [Myxococcales bacterium]